MKRTLLKPTVDQRMKVEELVAVGESHRAIAAVLAIDDKTLRKHFAVELRDGAANRRAEVVYLLFEQARKGNVAALRRCEELTRLAPPSAPVAKPVPLGKKEQANRDAETAHKGTSWSELIN